MPKLRRPVDPRRKGEPVEINFSEQPVAFAFVSAVKDGSDRPDCQEIAAFGTRGDGKTIAALSGMIAHAQMHHVAGYPLPVNWIGVADTFTSHKLKTIRSLENPLWKGGWTFQDNEHVALFGATGGHTPLVRLDLFGIEDQGAMDRVRMETVGVWFEEPAPSAVLVQSSGVSESAWLLARTSQRIPSHFHPAIITTNYPDEDHWTWQRFVLDHVVGTRYFRVPPGERASAEQREEWKRALANRPDLLRRLLEGEPGVVMLGDQVAHGFSRSEHMTTEAVKPEPGAPLYFGFDFGHTPTCVVGGFHKGTMVVHAGLFMQGVGMKQLMEEMVRPWLSRFAPWVMRSPAELALIGHDPSQGTIEDSKGSEADADASALKSIQEELDGWFEAGPIAWDNRKNALVQIFSRAHGLLIVENDFTRDLIRALDGRWYYPKSHTGQLQSDKPKKPNHPWEDLGDAFIYMLCRAGIGTLDENRNRPIRVLTNLRREEDEWQGPRGELAVLNNVY